MEPSIAFTKCVIFISPHGIWDTELYLLYFLSFTAINNIPFYGFLSIHTSSSCDALEPICRVFVCFKLTWSNQFLCKGKRYIVDFCSWKTVHSQWGGFTNTYNVLSLDSKIINIVSKLIRRIKIQWIFLNMAS